MPVRSASFCTIIAGANGSGKSTLYATLRPDGEFVNADEFARKLTVPVPRNPSIAAGRLALHRLSELVTAQQSFVYETTLSSHQSLNLMSRCKFAGYEVALVFVALTDVELHIRRIAERVARGGHDIPEKVVRRRYETVLRRLPRAISLADKLMVFDNSGTKPELLVSMHSGTVLLNNLTSTSEQQSRLAGILAKARPFLG